MGTCALKEVRWSLSLRGSPQRLKASAHELNSLGLWALPEAESNAGEERGRVCPSRFLPRQ
jgi:hypothetical protein